MVAVTEQRSSSSARRHLGTAMATTITKTTTVRCGHRAPTHRGRVLRPLRCRGEGVVLPWRRGELCGVHGPQRQAGTSPFLSDNIHDHWDLAEDVRVGLRWCGGGGGQRRTLTTRNDPPSRRRRWRRRQGESPRLSHQRFFLLH